MSKKVVVNVPPEIEWNFGMLELSQKNLKVNPLLNDNI